MVNQQVQQDALQSEVANQQLPTHDFSIGSTEPPKIEKVKDFVGTCKKLLAYVKRYLPLTIVSSILAGIGSLITAYGPVKLSELTDIITDGMQSTINLDAVLSIGVFLCILYVISFVFTYAQTIVMTAITQKITKSMREEIFNKVSRLPLHYLDKTSHGDVISRVINDVDLVAQTLNQGVVSLVGSILLFFGTMILMFATSVTLTFTAIISTIVGFVVMGLAMAKSGQYFKQQQDSLGELNGHIEETFSGLGIINLYNGTEKSNAEFKKINAKLRKASVSAQYITSIMIPFMMFVGNFGYVAICIVGGMLLLNGEITFGVIVAFMMYVQLFTQPLTQMGQSVMSLQSAIAAGERIFEFLDEEELVDETHKTTSLCTVKGDVAFKHVKFGYTEEKTIINDFSVQVRAGQKVAIVGPTGAGKTTIVNLLMRFYELNSGEIKIDNVLTTDMTREDVHRMFCMVLQDTWLFEGTIKENIIYNKKDVSDELIEKVCKAVGIDHFIRSLPEGYETVLSESINLSAGQKQLLTIARAMIGDAPLLILDEATSSVDTRTEVLIQKAMEKLMLNRTSFIIAHRLSTIKNADLILVMKDGDIVESGTHECLLNLNGTYAELYNSQFEQSDVA